MANQPWLEDVERRLTESRLPEAYIRRFMDELADHFQDVMEDTMKKNSNLDALIARLGEADQVAETAIVAYERRTFLGRHPSAKFWIFAVSPVVTMVAAFVLACSGVMAFGELCGQCGVPLNDQSHLGGVDPRVVCWGIGLVTIILPAALLAMAYGWCVRKWSVGRKWMLASCGVLAFIAMLPYQSISLSEVQGESLWSIGLAFPPSLQQGIQMLVPLVVGLWFACRPNRASSQDDRLRMAA
jgi:uncharacterized membrane protein YhaH (DUF805 family)